MEPPQFANDLLRLLAVSQQRANVSRRSGWPMSWARAMSAPLTQALGAAVRELAVKRVR